MILKIRVSTTPMVPALDDGWLWVDRIDRAQSYGFLPAYLPGHRIPGGVTLAEVLEHQGEPPVSETATEPKAQRLFATILELRDAVDRMWGPQEDRDGFTDELWPDVTRDWETNPRPVRCVRLERERGGRILAVLADEAFLLSENGDTLDRL